jgi:HSP20 family molecular chaperone IbpA
MEVRAATVENGILAIALELVVPEEKKPKKIQIAFTK